MRLRIAGMASALVLGLGIIAACGSDEKDDKNTNTTKPTTLSFTTDINPILIASCGAAGCHGTSGALSTVYVGQEAAFKASTSKAQMDSGAMPKTGYTISAADKKKLLDFLAQK